METIFFTWEDWEDVEAGVYQYRDCVLVVPIGRHGPREHFECIVMDYQEGNITLQRNGVEWKYNLILQVGDEIRN